LKSLGYPRKGATAEPVMVFDLETFAAWSIDLRPEHVYLGFKSKKSVKLPTAVGFNLVSPRLLLPPSCRGDPRRIGCYQHHLACGKRRYEY
jgi:hypothetical protein